jgi:prophage tail gpP-like protein
MGWYWDSTGLDVAQLSAFAQIAGQFNTQGTPGSPNQWVSLVAQQDGIDTEDRIVKVASFMNALLTTGM